MFCNHCGKRNPDGSTFCSSCGKLIAAPDTDAVPVHSSSVSNTQETKQQAQSTYQPSDRPNASPAKPGTVRTPLYASKMGQAATQQMRARKDSEKRQQEIQIMIRRYWRSVFASPLFLITVIVFSVSFFISFIEVVGATGQATEMLDLIGLQDISESMNMITIVSMIPTGLMGIGLWMLYAESQNPENEPIRTTGVSLIYGIQIFNLVVACLVIFGVCILSCSAFGQVSGYSGYGSKEIAQSFAGIIFGIIIAAGIIIAFYSCLIRVLYNAKKIVIDTSCVKTVALFCGILAGVSLIAAIASPEALFQSLLSCSQMVLFCAVFMQYKNAMEEADYCIDILNKKSEMEKSCYICANCKSKTQNPNRPCINCGTFHFYREKSS